MTAEEIKNIINSEFVTNFFEGSTFSEDADRWVITVCGKVIAIQGRIFYPTKKQAVKAFYNAFHWRAYRAIWTATHQYTRNPWWNCPTSDRSIMWKAFKETLVNDYGLNFIKV